jgi:Protein of unknown function (DUF1580)
MAATTKKPRSAKPPTPNEPDPAERLSMKDVARQFQSMKERSKPVDVSTVWRWAHDGVRGVKLKLFREAGRRYSTQAAVDEFKAALEALDDPEPETRPPSKSNAKAAKRVKHAERELDAVGI